MQRALTHKKQASGNHASHLFFSKASFSRESVPFFSAGNSSPIINAQPDRDVNHMQDPEAIQPQEHETNPEATQYFDGGAPLPPPESNSSPIIQTKLTVSKSNDQFEQEAERVADQVMQVPNSSIEPQGEAKKDDMVHRKATSVQATTLNQEQRELEVPPIVHEVLRSPGQPLELPTRAFMEPRFGNNFSQVRIHTDTRAAEAASAINARAFTQGRNVVFAAGEYDPGSAHGRNLLAHELAHFVQASGDVRLDPNRKLETASRGYPAQHYPGSRPTYRAGRPMIWRAVPRPAARRTATQIFGDPTVAPPVAGMTLAQFNDYTQEQADWFVEPTLAAGTNRDDLWRLLLLIEEGPHILSGIGNLQVSDLRAVATADWVPLRTFCRGTHSSSHTVRIFPPFPALPDRIALGRTLVEIEAVIPPAVLEVTVSQAQLLQVQTQVLLPILRTYWGDFQPHIEQTFTPTPGASAPEFDRVLTFLNALGAGGLMPLAPLRGANPNERWVRNLHRFPLPMLLRLVANLSDTSGTKRLILVLHTGHDAPGSFQLSANLFSDLVLLSPNNLVLMIEGATSLAAITTRIPTITSTWGQNVGGTRRISQVLIAGHGSAQTTGMAGTGAPQVAGGSVSYPPEERLNIGGSPAARNTTRDLLDALLQNMDPAQARILYAGCLVGSTHVAPGTSAAAIPGALAAHQSLGAFTEARATAAGIPAGRVQAARASVALSAATSLFNPVTGELSLTYPFDPNAFGSASTYASTGREPAGVLHAAVEVGAVNRVTAETLLRTRLAMPAVAGGWYDTITRLLVGLALPPLVAPPSGVDLQRVNELANIAFIPFLAFWPQFNIVAARFTNRLNPQPFAASIYAGVAATAHYTTPTAHHTERMRIIVDQGWLALSGAAQAPTLLAGILATGLPGSAFEAFLDLTVVGAQAAALLPLVGVPTAEQIRLALAWFSRDNTNAHVRSFLSAQVLHAANAPAVFTPAVSTEITAAGRTDREVLAALGFAPTATAATPVSGGAGQPLANLALPGSATNTLLLTGRPYAASVTSVPNTIVRNGPSLTSHQGIMALVSGATVHVMGFTGGWAAVDVWGRLGFIHQSDLSPPSP